MDFKALTHALDHSLAIIMGGGAGTRLFPLTKDRSKPAVPLGGKYRLVDIPISNCLNSGLRKVYVLTQYNSASLHRHINEAYKFDNFSSNFVEILAAQQTPDGNKWYQGTADAVRQNIRFLDRSNFEYIIILSGDQLYRMDYAKMLEDHLDKKSDITIATLPVVREDAKAFGIMETDEEGAIQKFVEKPKEDDVLDQLRMPKAMLEAQKIDPELERFQASMGIYIFNKKALVECLNNDLVDFGKHIIPTAINNYKVQSHIFQGYWEDIGTIRSFFEANLDLTQVVPNYDFFDASAQIFTNARFLPASKINGANIQHAVISDGCIISDATVHDCIIGVRGNVEEGSVLKECVYMGNDYYEAKTKPGRVPLGIGRNCNISRAIIDKNVRIGDRVVISPRDKPENMDAEKFCIRDGIVVIPKNTEIPSDTWI